MQQGLIWFQDLSFIIASRILRLEQLQAFVSQVNIHLQLNIFSILKAILDKAMRISRQLIARRSRTVSIRNHRTATKVRIRTETVNRHVLSDVSAPVSGKKGIKAILNHIEPCWYTRILARILV